ncbi:hypothetical protein IV203_007514 [Nitzschia inconspicua]|uniref:Uncharacterized protein n=1 Tax=Nitzschia inconspicua TaxID=303405 RepID=A0A9K3KFP8_9STRA|nr:hypothetical protein IV203_007514 [Nitzschia inconspicua]
MTLFRRVLVPLLATLVVTPCPCQSFVPTSPTSVTINCPFARQSTYLFSTLVSQPVEQSKYIQMMAWLQDNGAVINDKIEIRASSQGDGYGAFVNEPVAEGELLFEIPRNLCLTIEDATGDADCGKLFTQLIEKVGPGGNTVAMAGYMAKEYLISLEDEGFREDAAKKSRWGPYFYTLPWRRGVNNQEHVLFWEDERVETLLVGSLCYGEATSLREEVALAIRILGPMVSKPIQVARGKMTNSGFRFPWQTNDREASYVDPRDVAEGLPEAVNLLVDS